MKKITIWIMIVFGIVFLMISAGITPSVAKDEKNYEYNLSNSSYSWGFARVSAHIGDLPDVVLIGLLLFHFF